MAETNIIINIQSHYINRIISEAGFPLLKLKDMTELGSDEISILQNFKELVLWPAMQQFFIWFPVLNKQEYQVSSTFNINFPNTKTFGVTDARLNTAGFIARDVTNPFVNNSIYRSVSSSSSYGGGMYGTNNEYEMRSARISERLERQAIIDYNKAFRVNVDEINRTISGFTNVTARVIVTWAEYSEDFDKIPFRRVDEVISLAKAYLLRYLGQLRGQQNSNLPNTFNYQMFLERADKLEKEIIGQWRAKTKVVLIRG